MKNIAAYAISTGVSALFVLFFGAISACSSLQPPPRAVVFDFGPGATTAVPSNRMANLPPLVLAEVQAHAALDSTAVLYRLGYSDVQQLRPYAQARWSMAPAQLVRQRLREQLGQRRAVLQAAHERRVVVVDGFIATSAVLVAHALQPLVLQRCVFAHRSGERGHEFMLQHLGVQALLDLGMRLGEGSGGALAWPLLMSACAILREMASFESAGVSEKSAAQTSPV